MNELVYEMAKAFDFGGGGLKHEHLSLDASVVFSNQTVAADSAPTDSNSTSGFGRAALALFLSTVGSFFTALSFTLMKFSINRNQRLKLNKPAYKQVYWMIGFVFIFVSTAFGALSLNYGSLLLLSSSSSITMIFNLLMARFFLKEFFNIIWDTLAIFLIITGSVICLVFSAGVSGSEEYTE